MNTHTQRMERAGDLLDRSSLALSARGLTNRLSLVEGHVVLLDDALAGEPSSRIVAGKVVGTVKLYNAPRPERYQYGHGIDGQYLDIPLPATFATEMVRRFYQTTRRSGVPAVTARSIVWNCLWLGGIYGSIDDLHSPWIRKEVVA